MLLATAVMLVSTAFLVILVPPDVRCFRSFLARYRHASLRLGYHPDASQHFIISFHDGNETMKQRSLLTFILRSLLTFIKYQVSSTRHPIHVMKN